MAEPVGESFTVYADPVAVRAARRRALRAVRLNLVLGVLFTLFLVVLAVTNGGALLWIGVALSGLALGLQAHFMVRTSGNAVSDEPWPVLVFDQRGLQAQRRGRDPLLVPWSEARLKLVQTRRGQMLTMPDPTSKVMLRWNPAMLRATPEEIDAQINRVSGGRAALIR